MSCFDLNYLPGGRAVMAGIQRFHPEVKRYALVPPQDVSPVQQALGDLAEVRPLPRKLRGVPERLQPAAGRVFAVSLPEEVVAYFDADVCICQPIAEWWDVPDNRVNVVHDCPPQVLHNLPGDLKAHFAAQFPEVSRVKGFNSGVMALQPRAWADLPERFEAALEAGQYAYYPAILDQPLLNGLMYDRANWLPDAFNVLHFFEDPIPSKVRILHFTSVTKPWMPGFPRHESSYYYWERYGLMNENPWSLLMVQLNSQLQTPARSVLRRLRSLWRRTP